MALGIGDRHSAQSASRRLQPGAYGSRGAHLQTQKPELFAMPAPCGLCNAKARIASVDPAQVAATAGRGNSRDLRGRATRRPRPDRAPAAWWTLAEHVGVPTRSAKGKSES